MPVHPRCFRAGLALALGLAMTACSASEPNPAAAAAPSEQGASPASLPAEGPVIRSEAERLNAWFETVFEARVLRDPDFAVAIGRSTGKDAWTDASDAFDDETYAVQMAALAEMQSRFDRDALDAATRLSWDLFVYQAERATAGRPFKAHWYEFSQFGGPHSGIPAFMINQMRVSTLDDLSHYISRLNGIGDKIDQHIANAEAQADAGILPPLWAYPQMIATARNVVSGAPFDDGAPSALFADALAKIDALDIPDDQKSDLTVAAARALTDVVGPAYSRLIAMFEAHQARATLDDGAWKLPAGAAYYAHQLKNMTTTDLSAAEIHDLGLAEVARIHEEMRSIMAQVGFEGDLQAFFTFMRTDPQFYYPNTDEGREAYLDQAIVYISGMRARLDELFIVKPKADMEVRRVEPFRERAAGKAFYQRPAQDGSRPGVYYANLYDMSQMPKYEAEALAYHEGIPGHHMQIAIQQELQGVPSFRRFSGVTAYSEGWGLYTEKLPKEFGFYDDPYSDFGRLAMELWRAARLVVDTGLHDKRWTREEAIAYLVANTPAPEAECAKSIERYIVMPGQATAYTIGMIEILNLRARARTALGDRFDLREFHDVILKNGPVPLAVLDSLVTDWIAAKTAAAE